MSGVDEGSVGARVATLRKRRGMSQQRLAVEAHLSKSLLSKVETGHKPATQPFVAAVARVLGVHVTDLTGQPYHDGREHAAVPELRRALTELIYPEAVDREPRPLDELRDEIARVSDLGQAAALTRLGGMLPSLLDDLAATAHAASGHNAEAAYGMIVEAAHNARGVAHRLGYLDLSSLAIQRCYWAAERSGDPLAVGVARALEAVALLSVPSFRPALAVVDRGLAELEPGLPAADDAALSIYGTLNLRGGIIASRSGDAGRASEYLAEAQETAGRMARNDANHYQMTFGPTNVALHRVAAAVEMSDDAGALERGRRIQLPADLPRERAAHFYTDMARAHLWRADRDRSLRCLLKAEKISPEQTRHHPMVRETTYALIRAERHAKDSLRGLANRVGLPD